MSRQQGGAGPEMAEVVLEGVGKRFDRAPVLEDVSLTVGDREFVVFVGPSGCGKSTLLRLIAGLEDLSAGTVRIGGEVVNDVEPADRGVAMVFQSYALYPHLSVYDNMALGLKMAGRSRTEIDARVRRAASILQIEDLLARKPRQLSGGQRQRVAIGRAIVKEPRVFLFDEPLSNLDAELRVQMRVEIHRLHRELGATMIYVTHDQEEAMTMADRIVVLRDGRVQQIGPPLELYRRPANRFVAGFIGSPKMNFLEVTASGRDGDGLTLQLPGGSPLALPAAAGNGEPRTLGIRPEHLELRVPAAEEAPALHGEIFVVERLGAESQVHVRLPGGERVVAITAGERELSPGTPCSLHFAPRRAYLFDAADRTLFPAPSA